MTTDRNTSAIRLCDVVVDFGQTRLAFDADIKAGGIVAITGPYGAGKSTLLNVIAGFETPDSGMVEMFGADITEKNPAERPVSVIFQENNLFAHLDAFTNVGLGIGPSMKLAPADADRVREALNRVGLSGFERRLPATLSGGERQRVAFARALVRRRPILLLDEPFAALDPGLRDGMGRLLRALHAETGNTILMITHHPRDVMELADSAIFIDAGRIVLHADRDAFLAHRAIPGLNAFLGRPEV